MIAGSKNRIDRQDGHDLETGRDEKIRIGADALQDRGYILNIFEDNYEQVQYALVQFFSEHLTDCSRTFKGDLTAMLVLAIIGQAHLAAKRGLGAPGEHREPRGVHALRIADVTGIPRETVRRKLAVLQEIGWIEHADSGWVLVSASNGTTNARRDLRDINERGLKRLARLFNELSQVLGGGPRITQR